MNKYNLNNSEIYKKYNLKDYISLIIIFSLIIICIISFFIGVMTKFNKIITENKNKIFKKNIAIRTSIIFTIFTMWIPGNNKLYDADCPEYKIQNINGLNTVYHFQITNILSLTIAVLVNIGLQLL